MTERLSIHQRMAEVMKSVKGVAKTQINSQGGGYKYAGHERVTEALREHYIRLGIVRSASLETWLRDANGGLTCLIAVTWLCADNAQDSHTVKVLGEAGKLTREGGLSPVQFGIALSYAVKNAEFKAFSLTGDDTPDADAVDDKSRAPDAVMNFLEQFSEARTQADIDAVTSAIKKAGSAVQDHRQELLDARTSAMKRMSA